MGKRQDKSQDKTSTDKVEPEAAKEIAKDVAGEPAAAASPPADDVAPAPLEASHTTEPATGDLPIVESPKLGAGDDAEEPEMAPLSEPPKVELPEDDVIVGVAPSMINAATETPRDFAAEATGLGSQPRSFRFALLAATIAVAAGAGSVIGSLAASGFARPAPAASATIPRSADAHDVLQALKAQLAEVTALKAQLEGVNRTATAQFARIADRLDAVEKAEADPVAKLARIADTVDRLDKRLASAPETTGSVAIHAPVPPPPPPVPATDPTATGPILDGWVVEDVRNGRAMVESRYGGVFVVGSGSILPGIGRVEAVKRQNGQWIVVTARGLITSAGH